MKVVVTGANGFVGRKLVSVLGNHEVLAVDLEFSSELTAPNVTRFQGDFGSREILEKIFRGGCDAVVHLATIPGGAAEERPTLAMQVNVVSTLRLADAAAKAGACRRFVFASSIAVLGNQLPEVVDDSTAPAPTTVYGGQKEMIEHWLATLTRRGDLDAVSLRLPGIVARPADATGFKSAFLSNVFHALSCGESIELPVSRDATTWLMSVEQISKNLAHSISADLDCLKGNRAINLPSLRVRMSELVAEIERQTKTSKGLVSWVPETAVESDFGSFPNLVTRCAEVAGFEHDGNLSALVRRSLKTT